LAAISGSAAISSLGRWGLEAGYGLDGGVGHRLSSVILQGKIILQ